MWFWFQLSSLVCWSFINVFDSLLVHHYHRHPMVLGWNQSYWSLLILLLLVLLFGIPVSAWMAPLLVAGMVAYMGDVVFWRTLDLIDVSVTTIAWALLSLFLAIGGFVLFHESWTLLHTVGAVLALSGVGLLSLWHRKITSIRALLLLPLLALLYTPFYILQKSVLLQGDTVFAAFFWLILGRETTSFVLPWVVPSFRRQVIAYMPKLTLRFHALNAVVIAFFFGASYLTTLAYARGPISLVAMISNLQPFLVLFLAWMFVRLWPRKAPRELLTTQSVQVKLGSFAIVFLGLALLAFSQ